MTAKKGLHRAKILKVNVDSTQESQLLGLVDGWIGSSVEGRRHKKLVFTPNPEMLVDAWRDEDFRKVLNSADVNIADGVGLQMANFWLRLGKGIRKDQTVSTRLPGADVAKKLVELVAGRGGRVYLLGGVSGVAEKAKVRLLRESRIKNQESSKGFSIRASAGPESGLSLDEWNKESEKVIKDINGFRPDLLLVAFGHRKQEKWLVENKEKLDFGVGMGVGGTLDYMSGRVRRSPMWMSKVGLEWSYRLVREPWRWRRVWKAVVVFPWLVVRRG